jgi:stearoyl-CoA desaturase (delta-9 desaturase)
MPIAIIARAWSVSVRGQRRSDCGERHHHRYSDQPEGLHSAVRDGFWWAHVGWILSKTSDDIDRSSIRDLARYPELRALDRWKHTPGIALAVLLFLVGGPVALVWGFFVSTVLLWHGTFTINSLSHLYGSRRYATTDTSRNNPLLAVITLGEGWHNNHHYYQRSAAQGFLWWELDLTYYALRAMQRVGLVSGVSRPPAQVIAGDAAAPPTTAPRLAGPARRDARAAPLATACARSQAAAASQFRGGNPRRPSAPQRGPRSPRGRRAPGAERAPRERPDAR